MRTIAQKYIDEGIEQAFSQAFSQAFIQGFRHGFRHGIDKGVEKTAINMLMQNADVKFIAKVTGYSINQIAELKNKL